MGGRMGNKERRFGEADRRACWIADIKGDLMIFEKGDLVRAIGPAVYCGRLDGIGLVTNPHYQIQEAFFVVCVNNSVLYMPQDLQKVDFVGELGEKDAEITRLKCELDAAKTYVAQARLDMHMAGSYSLTELRAERDRLAETVRFQDEMIREMSEDSIPAFEQDRLRRDARIILELMASCLPLSLPDISDRLGWKMPRVCETMAMLRIAGRVKLEKGEYGLVE
jgi:hypothetical protein